MAQKATNLEEMLDRIGDAADGQGKVTLGEVVEEIGNRSFGPLLLLAGVIAFSPLSGIPGLPTSVAILVALLSGQLLLHRKHFWMPGWLLRRSISRDKLEKALQWVRPPARFVDRGLRRRRLQVLVSPTGVYVIAAACLLIALGMPLTELVPFSATGAGAALTAFGLALLARDGLVALLAFLLTGVVFGLVGYSVLWQ
jgi:hypothetical protein